MKDVEMTCEQRDIVIVGAGIGGLSAAYRLQGRDVVVFEASDRVGGRIMSRKCGPYWMSVGAHVIGGPDTVMGSLAEDMGLSVVPIRGESAVVWCNGRLVRGGMAETFPFRLALPATARLSLIRTGLRLKRAAMRATRQTADAIHGNRSFDGDYPTVEGDTYLDSMTFADVLGRMKPEVGDIFRAATNRLSAEPREISGHFGASLIGNIWLQRKRNIFTVDGGLGEICRSLADRLGDRIVTSARVTRIQPGEEWTEVHVRQGGVERKIRARYVVFAAPSHVARSVIRDLPQDKAQALDQVRFGPYVVMAVSTREQTSMPYDDSYATLVSGRTISTFFNTVNPRRSAQSSRQPGGCLMMYAGADRAAALLSASDEQIRSIFLEDAFAVYPELRGKIDETWICRVEHGFPFWTPGRLARQEALARPLGNILFAGDWLEYPSTDAAARSAQLAAKIILDRLG